ncbi:MAG: alanine--tRNA ligase [Parcubacteria group bacterium]|nr:alanine--tRNA ligase [Parcubacteria group bacterium]
MQSHEIRERFLKFFEKRGHTIIPSASLVPENDPSVLFNTAGMQPLVPYLLGQTHPTGAKRIADVQKCVRTNDIDEVGDNTHDTFFEMLGNWSLGDYFKEEAILWSFEFLTSKEEGLGLDPKRLYVTVFEGDDNAPRDEEAYGIWKKIFEDNKISGERIYFMGAKSNWWSAGESGPCGPDSEMFYDVTGKFTTGMTKEEYVAADDRQDVVEIWNDVFMEYEKRDGKVIGKLANRNVDTGTGLERATMVAQGKDNIFDTDLFLPIIAKINELGAGEGKRAKRIIADHVRASVFLITDGVVPTNTDQGYILRRLLRRAVRFADSLGMEGGLISLVDTVIEIYKSAYPNLLVEIQKIKDEIQKEEEKFRLTLSHGMTEFEKLSGKNISGKDAFDLYQSYGFPFEVTQELAKEKGITVDEAGFEEEKKKHQEISRQGSEQKFKGGLADHSEMSVKYHTATHLLHQALRAVLGEGAVQKGSNITPERLRFDFVHDAKMTDEEKKRVEDLVNEKIREALPVSYEDISMEEAKKRGAIGLFEEKYGDTVRVYQIGGGDKKFSLELCGGPHVKNTSELGHFKIIKEEACSAGIRRIKAILE